MKKNNIKIFETHAHYDDEQFDKDRDKILPLLKSNGIDKIVNISYDKKSIKKSIELSEKYEFVYAAIGYHPCDCADMKLEDLESMQILSKNEKVVAIGEIGLDYYWKDVQKDIQKKWFIKQLDLANEVNLPVVIHSREAAQDTFDILKNKKMQKTGVIHCYAYSLEMAKEYIKLGYYIGIGGVVTFKNAKNIKEVVSNIPLDKIVLETDSPYLAPTPFRGKRNSSINLIYVVDEISRLKGISKDEVVKVTYENARKMYAI